MATETQRKRLREDTNTDFYSLPDDEIDEIYTEAGESYTNAASIDAKTRVIVFQRLMAQSADRTTYKQNQSTEELSDLIKNYKTMLEFWRGELVEAEKVVSAATGAMRMGKGKRVPSRLKEFPDA